jgi:hypothetical protein
VLSQSHYLMLQRNLLYTALSRARQRAVIIVSGGLQNKQTGHVFKTALEVAVGNDRIARRYSGLAERLVSVSTDHLGPPPPGAETPTRHKRQAAADLRTGNWSSSA